jgi:hypothetical protein
MEWRPIAEETELYVVACYRFQDDILGKKFELLSFYLLTKI